MTEQHYLWVISYLGGKQTPSLGEHKYYINKNELSPDMYDLFKSEISKNTGLPIDEFVLLSIINFGVCKDAR
jgi:hypothetical protein